MTQAFGLLDRFDPATNPHPATVIAVPTQRRLFVAQLAFVTAQWTAADYGAARLSAAAGLQQAAPPPPASAGSRPSRSSTAPATSRRPRPGA